MKTRRVELVAAGSGREELTRIVHRLETDAAIAAFVAAFSAEVIFGGAVADDDGKVSAAAPMLLLTRRSHPRRRVTLYPLSRARASSAAPRSARFL